MVRILACTLELTVNIEIGTSPLEFHLCGLGSQVDNSQFGAVGMRLMNELWSTVRAAQVPTKGTNHWVYLADRSMFVGVELQDREAAVPQPLKGLDVRLSRYAKHVHVGPYQELPAKWLALTGELAARGEVIRNPSLEVYGHHSDEPGKQETTILIGLGQRLT